MPRSFVGTIEVGIPSRDAKQKLIRIPMTFSNGALADDEDIMVQRVDASVAGDVICFTAVTCPKSGRTPPKPAIMLFDLEAGRYKLLYESPDLSREFIAEVDIPAGSSPPR